MPNSEFRKRENADPHEQNNPIPRLVIGLIIGLTIWALVYILMANPDASPTLGDRRIPETLAQGGPGARVGPVDGRALYAANCQACHQATGQGLPGIFPPLAGSSQINGDERVAVQILLHGLTGPIEVLGVQYNGAMPSFEEQLSNEELAAVLSFVRSQWGNQAPPVTADTFATGRNATADRNVPWNGLQEIAGAIGP